MAKNILIRRPSKKLDLKYYNHFPIIEPIDKQAYKLKLGDSVSCIYLVIHISLLEHCLLTMRVNVEEPGAS